MTTPGSACHVIGAEAVPCLREIPSHHEPGVIAGLDDDGVSGDNLVGAFCSVSQGDCWVPALLSFPVGET